MPIDDVENTNGTNKWGNIQFTNKSRTLPWGRERMPPVDYMYRSATINWSKHPQGEEYETKTSIYDLDWLQKGIIYGPAKLDNRLSQNVLDIRRSHKVYRKYHRNLVNGIDGRRKKSNRDENPEGYVPGRCAITITIVIAMMLLNHIPRKCTGGYKLKSQENINHGQHQTVCQKMRKKWKP